MGITKNIIDKLPKHVLDTVEKYRFEYTHHTDMHLQAETRTRMAGYVLGLRDAGLITEFERRALFVYMTV